MNSRIIRQFEQPFMKNRALLLASRQTFFESIGVDKSGSINRFYLFFSGLSCVYSYILYKAKKSNNELLRVGAAGSLTMLLCDFSLYSIESVNARSKILRVENVGFREMVSRIIEKEGYQGMYKGYTASFYSIIFHGFVYFYVYKGLKKCMKERYQPQTTVGKAFLYGCAATLAQAVDLFCYPLEMIRVRLLTMNDTYSYKGVSDALQQIVKKEKFRGLYRGSSSYFMNLIGTYSVNLTLYELLIDASMKKHGVDFKKKEILYVIQASVLSALITVMMTNPLEVIVVRRQSGSIQPIKQMFQEEGTNMFTKGLTAKMMYASFSSCLFYLCMNKIGKFYDTNLSDELLLE